MPAYIDLHLHTHFSDGTSSPGDLLGLVRRSGVSAFSVTDHDTIEGYRAVRLMRGAGDPELLPGVELSAMVGEDDVHLLAYGFSPEHREFNDALVHFQDRRRERGYLMVDKLKGLGIRIGRSDVDQVANGAVVGRPHVAEALVRARQVGSYQEAFDRFIRKGAPAYVPKVTFTPQDAIDLVHRAGGVVLMAHPYVDYMVKHLETLLAMGLDGMEVWHPMHGPIESAHLETLAKQRGLLVSGGSDFHGREGRYGQIGSLPVPVACFEQLQRAVAARRGVA